MVGLLRTFVNGVFFIRGVILAILEKSGIVPSLPNNNSGTVAAGIQNFIICLEMLAAAVALR